MIRPRRKTSRPFHLEFPMSTATPTPLVAACDWSIVVLARSEATALARCLEAIRAAAAGQDAQVTVLLTGSAEASVAMAERFAAGGAPRLRVFHIPHADRANAWNQYVHALKPEAAMHVFVEAHAAMAPGALRSLAAALAEHPAAMAATGLPCSGPRAAAVRAEMRSGGALHGALHALRGEFLDGIAKAGLRLPVGLGEIHPVIAGLLGDRIVVAEEATWRAVPLGWFSPQGAVRAEVQKLGVI
ncbi:MAG: glycosyltransferase family 2 protein [Acetobacteraceae bacterium]|nr:MAG: glycosyltransferase family 2 protein [Acetobacteraceae bacterium]